MTEILQLLRARDAGAQAALRGRLFPKVLATCAHVLGDSSRAEEIAEDVWTDFLFRDVDRVRDPRAIPAYLRMMSVRRCIHVRDVSRRFDTLDAVTESEPTADVEADLLGGLDRSRTLLRLRACLQLLDRRQRQVVRLRFLHEMTLEQIGEELAVTKQYAGQIVKKSLWRLKRCIRRPV